jgi:hypothetical protein
MKASGECHCGRLKATFETDKAPAELGLRACQCGFCRRHGARTVSDPQGEVVLEAAAEDVIRYAFALKTCEFLICRRCGIYVAAVMGEGDDKRATLNAAGLALKEFLAVDAMPVQYGSETREERVRRRQMLWTPVRFSDPALEAANFGLQA